MGSMLGVAGTWIQHKFLVGYLLFISLVFCVVLLFCLSSSCVPNIASFSGLSILDCAFGFLKHLYIIVFVGRDFNIDSLLCGVSFHRIV